MSPKWAAQHIADLMKKSKHTIVFTGAGMSTESGIPDFRSNGGLWNGRDPMMISHAKVLKDDPHIVARFYRDRMRDMAAARPNRGHEILAEWEVQGKIWGIATQNIDGYHQRAGMPESKVLELHGNLKLYCSFCDKEYPASQYTDSNDSNDEDDFCFCADLDEDGYACGGTIRPNVTMFGEDLPQMAFQRALAQHAKADLCIILGSSCSVYPANSLPQHTIGMGGEVVIINKGPTDLDRIASYKIDAIGIGEALEMINKNLVD